METNNNNQKKQADQKQKQENPKQNAKGNTLNGTETTSNWEKAAEMIAGNNQLMAGLLKLLISPFTLIAGVGIIVYLFIKNTQFKKEIEKLKEENKKLSVEKIFIEEEAEHLNKKYKKLKKFMELEQNEVEQRQIPERTYTTIHNVNKNKSSILK